MRLFSFFECINCEVLAVKIVNAFMCLAFCDRFQDTDELRHPMLKAKVYECRSGRLVHLHGTHAK